MAGRRRSQEERDLDVMIGDRIRGARHARGVTARQLALRVNVTASQICDYEHGRVRISAAMLLRIALALDVSLRSLVPAVSMKMVRGADSACEAANA